MTIRRIFDWLGTAAWGATGAFIYMDYTDGLQQSRIETFVMLFIALTLWLVSGFRQSKPQHSQGASG